MRFSPPCLRGDIINFRYKPQSGALKISALALILTALQLVLACRKSHLRWLGLAKKVLAMRGSQSNGFQAHVLKSIAIQRFPAHRPANSPCAPENLLLGKRTKESEKSTLSTVCALFYRGANNEEPANR